MNVYTFDEGSSGKVSSSTVVILFSLIYDRSGDCIRVRINAQDSRDQEGSIVFRPLRTESNRFCHYHSGTLLMCVLARLY